VALPLKPPVKPQLALSRKQLPEGDGWAYEPKYDGFRAVVFVDGDDVFVQSRNGRPLSRYFPELRFGGGRYVLDGELVILGGDGVEEFDALQNRIHPAESRIKMLAEETPARFRVFDVLAEGRRKLLKEPFETRRGALEGLVETLDDPGSIELTPLVRHADEARPLLDSGEGVIAKELSAPYRPGERKGMVKVKRLRTLDCVVVGWRPGKEEGTVGSLILGLYEKQGKLRVVGHTSSFKAKEKRELRARLAPYETGERGAADPSRWASDRELEWVSLRPELVVEVSFDHVSAGRIRHGAKLLRWRDDKDPSECTFGQLR
jgi:ATP-dependent DNA ligase